MRVITEEELARHNWPGDIWMAIDGIVYDVTMYQDDHPGGDILLHEAMGTDATTAFHDVQHSQDAIDYMKKELPIMGKYVRQETTTTKANSTFLQKAAVHACVGLAACYTAYSLFYLCFP
jgi:cytochrome b5